MTDPRDLVELLDRGDPAPLVAELDDVGSDDRPDAVDRLEIGLIRRAEADRAVLGPGRGRGGSAGVARGDDDLLAVGKAGGEVERIRLGPAGRPAGAFNRVGYP